MELLIRNVHKHPIVSTAHESGSQYGDVIAAMPDGHPWSEAERNNAEWTIITADISEEGVAALMEAGRGDEPKWRRRIGINIEGLSAGAVLSRDELTSRYF